jgi:hypothetical protein
MSEGKEIIRPDAGSDRIDRGTIDAARALEAD